MWWSPVQSYSVQSITIRKSAHRAYGVQARYRRGTDGVQTGYIRGKWIPHSTNPFFASRHGGAIGEYNDRPILVSSDVMPHIEHLLQLFRCMFLSFAELSSSTTFITWVLDPPDAPFSRLSRLRPVAHRRGAGGKSHG